MCLSPGKRERALPERQSYSCVMDVTFLFLDESVDLDTAWLTGLFVSAEQYASVRDAVIRITQETLTAAGHNHLGPVDLHGVDLLRNVPGVTDAHRLRLFRRMVTLVNRGHIDILSVGHMEATKVRRNLKRTNMDPGEKFYSFNLNVMVDVLHLRSDGLIVPVFDGVPGRVKDAQHGCEGTKGKTSPKKYQHPMKGASGKPKRQQPVDPFAYDSFIDGARITQWNRVAAEKKPVPLVRYKKNLRNLVEPTFSDGKKSPLLQLSDIVGYLLGVRDRVDQEGVRSEWKASVANVARKIDPGLVHRRPVQMMFMQDK